MPGRRERVERVLQPVEEQRAVRQVGQRIVFIRAAPGGMAPGAAGAVEEGASSC